MIAEYMCDAIIKQKVKEARKNVERFVSRYRIVHYSLDACVWS